MRLTKLISIRFKKGIPRLILPDRFEGIIKWALRSIIVIGIASSVYTFGNWYYSLSFAVLLVLVEQFLERVIFQYLTMYVQPMPEFTYDPAEWEGQVFAFPVKEGREIMVGFQFATLEYANNFWSLISSWNYGELEDKENNVCLSFVYRDESRYAVYLYPNLERRTVKEFFEKVEKSPKDKDLINKEPLQLVVQMTFCKGFTNSGMFSRFKSLYKKDGPFLLSAFVKDKNGKFDPLPNTNPIRKYHCKIKSVKELNKTDHEYHHRAKFLWDRTK